MSRLPAPFAAALALTLLLALTLAACGGDAPAPTPTTTPADPSPAASTPAPEPSPSPAASTPSPTPASSPTAEPSATPAATPADPGPLSPAMRDLLEEVAALRGLEPPPTIDVRTVSRREVADLYRELLESEREDLDNETVLYQLLGYLEPDQTLWDITIAATDYVAGFYSTEHKALWVVTSADELVDPAQLRFRARETLVHEIIHAIQDYHFDLDALSDELSLDAFLAFICVVEGDAVISTDAWSETVQLLPGGLSRGSLLLFGQLDQVRGVPIPYLRELYFPYTVGASAIQTYVARNGLDALNDLLVNPPPATTSILHFQLLGTDWEPVADLDRLLPVDAISQSLGEGWSEREAGVLGEFHLVNYLLVDSPVPEWRHSTHERAQEEGEGWRGDAYRIFEHENGEDRVLTVVVRFEDAVEAEQWERAHARAVLGHAEYFYEAPYSLSIRNDGAVVARAAPVGDTVFFAIGTSIEAASAALRALIEE